LEFNVPFQHKYGYIRDDVSHVVVVVVVIAAVVWSAETVSSPENDRTHGQRISADRQAGNRLLQSYAVVSLDYRLQLSDQSSIAAS